MFINTTALSLTCIFGFLTGHHVLLSNQQSHDLLLHFDTSSYVAICYSYSTHEFSKPLTPPAFFYRCLEFLQNIC